MSLKRSLPRLRTAPPSLSLVAPTLVVLASLVSLACLAAAPAAADEVRSMDQTLYAGDAERVHIKLTFGTLEVRGTDERNAHVEMTIDCRRENLEKCKRRAERIRLQPRLSGGKLTLALKNTPRGQVQGLDASMIVTVPKHLALEVDVPGGDITVRGMTSHLEIDSGGGRVDVQYPQDAAEYVKVDVGFGKADLWTKDGNRIVGAGFPKSINWRGTGTAKVEIDVGGGEAEIRLH